MSLTISAYNMKIIREDRAGVSGCSQERQNRSGCGSTVFPLSLTAMVFFSPSLSLRLSSSECPFTRLPAVAMSTMMTTTCCSSGQEMPPDLAALCMWSCWQRGYMRAGRDERIKGESEREEGEIEEGEERKREREGGGI